MVGRLSLRRKPSHYLVQGVTSQGASGNKGVGGHRGPGGKAHKQPPLLPDTCYRCGKGTHCKAQDCKAVNATCRGCGKRGHYEKVCLGKHSAHSLEMSQMTSAGAGTSDPLYFNDEGQPVYTYMVSVPHANKHLINFPIALEPTSLRRKGIHTDSSQSTPHVLLKADTGADVNLINRETFNQLFDSKVLKPTPIKMENYGNSAIKVLGMFHAFLRWKEKVYQQLFYVTDCDRSLNLLSRDACYTLGVLKPCYTVEKRTQCTEPRTPGAERKPRMQAGSDAPMRNGGKPTDSSRKHSISQKQLQDCPITKQDILQVYSDVFTGIRKFPGPPYKFQLKDDAKPARHAPRKVPIHLQDAFHREIRNLEKLGILEETKDVTEWVNSFVIMEKKAPDVSKSQPDRKLRICLDPRDLNEALEREPYYTRSIEEIMTRFHGMTRFMIADFNKGYWMVELNPESRKYTTMALDIGRFQWTRLPMGSIVAQDVFQRKLDAIFLDIPGVTGIADDMVIYGKTDLEHDRHLINFLDICRKNTLTLNPDKMQFRLPQVSFFGHQWSDKGLSPDPKKVAAVKRMDLPEDVETMRSFLGLVNYLNRFSPRLAELCEPLREVCRQDTEFQLTKSVRVAFYKIKEEIAQNVTLPYFNPQSDTTLQTDASKKGLGAVILQDSKPVMFASRALTGAEKDYQNLERECLATIWGMEKFHYFLYGKHFTLETDQKPLASIYKKHMVDISPRIQRLVVRSFPYQPFDVQYRRGKDIPLADALSRVSPTPVEEDGIQLPIVAVNLITSSVPVSSDEIEMIREETARDVTLSLLRHYIHVGWPVDRRMLPRELHNFWNYREDLSMENGLITKGARLVIPSTLRSKVLEQIHKGHLGIEKCMLKAREAVFWPGISNDIREAVEKCGICQASSKSSKPIGNVSDVPPHAWHTLGTDLFYWNKIDYLVIGDYFSKYLIVRRLPNSSTHAVIKELGLIFTELGRPFMLRSDNGPCYSSREFRNFLHFHQVDHITSSPHYPQSNGFAEALVGIAKKLMDKSSKEGKPWNFGLLQYRTTPISSSLPSPLEMLTGRKPCLNLPQVPSSIGHNMDSSRIRQELLRRQPTASTSTGATLEPGQPVFVKEVHGNVWKTATIDQPAAEPDSYWVRYPDNSILRRTRSMIKPRSLPSHLELQAEAQQRNFETSFNQLNGQSMLPVTPTTSVTTPAPIDRDNQVGAPDPITGATSPQMTTPRRST